jgi:hypothetical protein
MKIPTSERPKLNEVMDKYGKLPTVSTEEVLDRVAELERWYDERIVFDPEKSTCTLLFNHPYEINLDRIRTTNHLFDWAMHLLEKRWLKRSDVKTIIRRIAEFKKIEIYC